MNEPASAASNWKTRTNSSLLNLAGWTGAWVLTTALATFGPEFLWSARWLTLTAILVNLGIGLGMIRSNIRYLKVIDEMMQKIQLEAMGLALGVGVVAGLSYSMLDSTDLISGHAEIGFVVLLMGLIYLVSVIIGTQRYQ